MARATGYGLPIPSNFCLLDHHSVTTPRHKSYRKTNGFRFFERDNLIHTLPSRRPLVFRSPNKLLLLRPFDHGHFSQGNFHTPSYRLQYSNIGNTSPISYKFIWINL